MVIIWISFEVIFVLLVLAVGLGYSLINSLAESLPWIFCGLLIGLLLTGIHCLLRYLRAQTNNILFTFAELMMFLGIIPGVWFYSELMYIDHFNRWMDWFGSELPIRFITLFGVLVLGSTVVMIIAAFLPRILQHILLIAVVACPFLLYWNGLEVCTQSFSDYSLTDFSTEDSLQEATIVEMAPIYYRSFKAENRLPVSFSKKYTRYSFEEGEVVYLPYSLNKEREYVLVSNGEMAGYVSVDCLELNDPPIYEYAVECSKETVPVYGCEEKVLVTFENGNEVTSKSRLDEVVEKLEQGEQLNILDSEDEYLLIKRSEDALGYVRKEDVEVVRQK